MRAGAFAEPRVIHLLNRRFVSAYFNTGGPGLGRDADAETFVEGKVKNRYAFLAAFTPSGEYLGETSVYASKHEVFDFLRDLLDQHPDFAELTKEEGEVLGRGRAADAAPEAIVAAARILEDLGDYTGARTLLERVDSDERDLIVARCKGLARIARHEADWARHGAALESLRAHAADDEAAFHALETGYGLIAERDFAAARRLLQPAARDHEASEHAADLHFYAGVASWLGGSEAWGRFHWCWVLENRPGHRLHWRAYVAAADDAMAYPNIELDRPKLRRGQQFVSRSMIETAVKRSMREYERLLGAYRARVFEDGDDAAPKDGADAKSLVARLVDGNAHVPANNEIVAKLEALGEAAVEPLLAAVRDPLFKGRGYAAYALGRVMKHADCKSDEAVEALNAAIRECLKGHPYVVGLAVSGLKLVGEKPRLDSD